MLINTLCLLIRDHPVDQILLGYKKVGFGAGKYVGIGGTIEDGETIAQAAVRELFEETGLQIHENDLEPVARITFLFPAKSEWNRIVHVFLGKTWHGDLQESAEVAPIWFNTDEIPYNQMWADASHWLPRLIEGECIQALFTFKDDNETIATSYIEALET